MAARHASRDSPGTGRLLAWRLRTGRTADEGAQARGPNSLRAMEHAHDLDLIRPWRRATIAITVFAAVELIVIAGIAAALLGNPLADHFRASAAAASTPRMRVASPVPA